MANNATNVWRWTGAISTAWRTAGNWTDGMDGAVDDFPDAAEDTVMLRNSAVNAMAACASATTVGTITKGSAYAGACCVANLTATTVTATSGTSGTVTGGTIDTLNAGSDTAVSGCTITTANLSGTATFISGNTITLNISEAAQNIGGTVTGVATINSTAVQYGTWGTDIVCNGDTTFDGNNTFAAGGTAIKPKKRDTKVLFAFGADAHTWTNTPTIQYSGAPYSKLWMDGHS